MPSMPSSARASFTSSSLKGLMIASSFFIAGKLPRARPFANRKRIAARALLATRHARCNYDFARIKEMSSRGRRAADADWGTGRKGALRRVDRAVSCLMLIQAAEPHFFNIPRWVQLVEGVIFLTR